MANLTLDVVVRERPGTGGSRAVRREGLVPGVIYGGKDQPVAIAAKANELKKALNTGKLLGNTITISHKGEKQLAIARDVQFHPVTDEALHFDLYRVEKGQIINIEVPVHFTSQERCPGIKAGGVLNIVRHTVELLAPADKIPDGLTFDLANTEMGESIRISQFELGDGVKPSVDRDFVVATLQGSRAAVSEGVDEDGEEETVETEVINQGGGDEDGGEA